MRPHWVWLLVCLAAGAADGDRFPEVRENARLATEGLDRCRRYVDGWLAQADPASGLIPRNLDASRDLWNAQDAAADNYPFMVLTCALVDRPRFEGRMREMLRAESRLTARLDRLPDTYRFSTRAFASPQVDLEAILFGGSEYVKDGLLPLTEWLGPSPWSERMLGIVDDLWKHAPVSTPYGRIVSDNVEVNGDLLQVLSRLYWMTGRARYLEWATRLGDYHLLGNQHPTRDLRVLRLRDHGCEIVSGLCELYATVHFAHPAKKEAYRQPIHEMLDRILAVGRNEHGLFYDQIDPVTGQPTRGGAGVADTWGYTLNAFYTVYLLDGTAAYQAATRRALAVLWEHYRNFAWEGSSADGYADSIESALNLHNREPIDSCARWIDSEIQVMWAKQRPDGIIEGWHGDGNFARTTVMYALWKTQGVTLRPWRADVRLGAVKEGDDVYLSLTADRPWSGRLLFDSPRHRTAMGLPLDYPRINQFPEWFTVEAQQRYRVRDLVQGTERTHSGKRLQAGLSLRVTPAAGQRLQVGPQR